MGGPRGQPKGATYRACCVSIRAERAARFSRSLSRNRGRGSRTRHQSAPLFARNFSCRRHRIENGASRSNRDRKHHREGPKPETETSKKTKKKIRSSSAERSSTTSFFVFFESLKDNTLPPTPSSLILNSPWGTPARTTRGPGGACTRSRARASCP